MHYNKLNQENFIPDQQLESQVLKALFAFLNKILTPQKEMFSIVDPKQYQDDKEST